MQRSRAITPSDTPTPAPILTLLLLFEVGSGGDDDEEEVLGSVMVAVVREADCWAALVAALDPVVEDVGDVKVAAKPSMEDIAAAEKVL